MRNIWLVIKREYLEKVRTKAFLFTTMFIPAVMGLSIFLPTKMATMKSSKVTHIVVVVSSQGTGDAIRAQLTEHSNDIGGKYAVDVDLTATDAERTALAGKVKSGEIDGFLWATDDDLAARSVTYTARNVSDFFEGAVLQAAVTMARMQSRLSAHGISPAETKDMLQKVSVKVETGEKKSSGEFMFLLTFILGAMLFTTVLVYGITVMRSVLEEKNSRVMEVLLSALTPKELMTGKIIGVAAVGLTQIAIWAALAGVLGGPTVIAVGQVFKGVSIPPAALIFFGVFFLLGYLLYSSMYAALGALVSTDQEGQQLQIVVMGPLLFAYLMMFGVLRQPNSVLSFWLSLVPFFAPLLMYMRIMVQPPPAWQIGLSIVLMMATIYGMVSLCARIYRIGILMYGKRPTLPEIWKWLKYA
ncbi:MAG TPA: ABC transporter permease [Terriglobales bacterium]|jgi:ABC-2 type transport system permease protein|nr:ABC transporter permease [Terriglobales bacterium]